MMRWLLVLLVACADPPADDRLQIAGASPGHGPLVGGTTITITGTGFRAAGAGPSRVVIAGREAPLASVVDDTTLAVVIPPGEQPGDAEVVVLNQTGSARAAGIFRYSTPPTITAVAPQRVLYSSSATTITVSGTGFLAEGAGEVAVVVDGVLALDVEVTSDTTLTFTAPAGRPFARPRITVIDQRGRASLDRGFEYRPSNRGGLLLFTPFGPGFAVFFDPVDHSTVMIPWVGGASFRATSVVRDARGDLWAIDRYQRFGKIDLDRQQLQQPIQSTAVIPAMVRAGDRYFGIARVAGARFGSFEPATGVFAQVGTEALPCCGSFGIAFDGTTLYYASVAAVGRAITPIDPTTGISGPPVPITGVPGIHVEEMRFFDGTLYAANRDGTLVAIDPVTGAATVIAGVGRFNAMEVYDPE